ncbi:sugar phosphate isomerase/epimerase family protein [Bifidobacterium olomucense]|uniref:Xylose isomerase n=1 Tax=Bifidobacterium olomucense TaxID=2675324 RepID=A0A7Y0HWB1_9BIFI|nr:sugar phosphate isomerase/epimerase [Bifidobacterium sp. DSM 109959]NMM99000.1 xylose isomerase [Bifidobacterium sp. DSM 109959]
MKISVFYDHVAEAAAQTGKDLPELFAEIRALGITGLEVEGKRLAAEREMFAEELPKAGLEVSNIYEFFEFGDVALAQGETAHAQAVIDLAAQFGAGRVMPIPGFLPEDEAARLTPLLDACDWSADHAAGDSTQAAYRQVAAWLGGNARVSAMRDALRHMVAYAAGRNITVTIEDFDAATSPIARIAEIRWFLEQVPGLGHTLDTGNYVFSDENCDDAYRLFRDRIMHFHVKDRGIEPRDSASMPYGAVRKGMAVVPTGGGYMPIARLIRAARMQTGYDGYFAIEHFDAPNQLQFMRQSAAFLRALA